MQRQAPPLIRHTTLHDVARECGVSAMTVSRVLGDRDGVSKQTRERVLAAARRMNYEPSALAINFARNRSGFIGVATHFKGLLGSIYFSDVMAGFQQTLHGTGNDFALFDTMSEVFDNPEELAKLYRQRRADGLLIVAPHRDDKYLKTLVKLGVAFVVIGERVDDHSVPSISCNDEQGVRLLCEHLKSLGHREIACISGAEYLGSARRRRKAYIEFMREEGISVPKHFLQRGAYMMEAGEEGAVRILKEKRRPTAILAPNDLSALGVVKAIRASGLRVPEDISVCGFDDLHLAVESRYELTTIHQSAMEVGKRGSRLLLEALDTGRLPAAGHVDVDVSLVVRSSTAPAAA